MEKRPEISGQNKDLEPAERKTELEIIDPGQRKNPFISFRYSYREVSSVGGKTHLRAKEKSFENGKFKLCNFSTTPHIMRSIYCLDIQDRNSYRSTMNKQCLINNIKGDADFTTREPFEGHPYNTAKMAYACWDYNENVV